MPGGKIWYDINTETQRRVCPRRTDAPFLVRGSLVFFFLRKKGAFRAPARVTFGPDEIFLSFASGGLLLSIATKVTKSAIQGGRDFDFPSPLKNPYP